VNAEQILSRVAVVFGVERQQLPAGSRTAHLVEARQAAAYLLFFGARLSYADVARELGYKDHSTAIWAVQAAAERAKRIPAYSDKIGQIGAML
jgi:chromosomal replication initiator protein